MHEQDGISACAYYPSRYDRSTNPKFVAFSSRSELCFRTSRDFGDRSADSAVAFVRPAGISGATSRQAPIASASRIKHLFVVANVHLKLIHAELSVSGADCLPTDILEDRGIVTALDLIEMPHDPYAGSRPISRSPLATSFFRHCHCRSGDDLLFTHVR
jgi:hypothetical protein